MKLTRLLILIVAALYIKVGAATENATIRTTTSATASSSADISPEEAIKALDAISSLVVKEVTAAQYDVRFLQMKNGITMMTTKDGRYICIGDIYSGWGGRRKFESLDELQKDLGRANLQALRIDYANPKKFFVVPIAPIKRKSRHEFVVLVDSLSKAAKPMIQTMRHLADAYGITIYVMPTPIISNKSIQTTTQLICASKKINPLNAIVSGKIPNVTKCDKEQTMNLIKANYSLFRLMRFNGAPVTIDASGGGDVVIGFEPKQIEHWIKAHLEN